MTSELPKFSVGEIVEHKKFGYRGVIFDVDAQFSGTTHWYDTMAKSKPPKDAPWYHVLVDGQRHATYVAERHLAVSSDVSPVHHPLMNTFFSGIKNNKYIITNSQ